MRDQLEALKGQQVEVIYNGMAYRGRLMDTTDEEVNLQTREQWISLPMEGITSVRGTGDAGAFPGFDEGQGPAS